MFSQLKLYCGVNVLPFFTLHLTTLNLWIQTLWLSCPEYFIYLFIFIFFKAESEDLQCMTEKPWLWTLGTETPGRQVCTWKEGASKHALISTMSGKYVPHKHTWIHCLIHTHTHTHRGKQQQHSGQADSWIFFKRVWLTDSYFPIRGRLKQEESPLSIRLMGIHEKAKGHVCLNGSPWAALVSVLSNKMTAGLFPLQTCQIQQLGQCPNNT